eukprot:CAMPEP_0181301576 /NCGR_PEP_ID=MMETSP1101-20121128/7499_1 /TAXON_ID=46948 /ORGANISM="Rhodomonas abbreviata, Strain Caron Lab Isolate" /LENGTH=115 /DNA_ID=CAMNT_0023406893 /DNA_START=262 /DNA_END=605 /DNA_ORIENTATION=+
MSRCRAMALEWTCPRNGLKLGCPGRCPGRTNPVPPGAAGTAAAAAGAAGAAAAAGTVAGAAAAAGIDSVEEGEEPLRAHIELGAAAGTAAAASAAAASVAVGSAAAASAFAAAAS